MCSIEAHDRKYPTVNNNKSRHSSIKRPILIKE